MEKPEVHVDSEHEFHVDMYKTLVLLSLAEREGPVYFVVEGCASFTSEAELQKHEKYFYEEHTCPTNFIGGDVVAVYEDGNRDPHGAFLFVRAVWMPQRYVEAKAVLKERGHNMGWNPEDVLEELFPELLSGGENAS